MAESCEESVISQLDLLTVVELKKILKEHGLPTAGSKNELILKLQDANIRFNEVTCAAKEHSDKGAEENQDDRHANGRDEPPISLRGRVEDSHRNELEMATPSRESEMELLRRERDLAEREVQLMRREMEFLRTTERAPTPQDRASVSWTAAKDMIGNCDGDNCTFSTWDRQIRSIIRNVD